VVRPHPAESELADDEWLLLSRPIVACSPTLLDPSCASLPVALTNPVDPACGDRRLLHEPQRQPQLPAAVRSGSQHSDLASDVQQPAAWAGEQQLGRRARTIAADAC
jgi:hypothetical protein